MVTIHTICKSAVEIGHEVMKKSLNNIDFTDFFGKRMLKSLNLEQRYIGENGHLGGDCL